MDKTSKIIHNYNDKRIKCYAQNHKGVSSARNLGIKNASGEYLFFLDADDTIQPCCIEELHKIASSTDADMVVIRQPNKFIRQNTQVNVIRPTIEQYNGENAALEILLYKTVISSWGKLIRRQIITENNICFNPELSYGEGFSFTIESFLRSKKVCFTNQKLYNYRIDSQTSVMSKYKESMISNSYNALKYISSKVPKDRAFINALKYTYFHTTYDLLNTLIATKTKSKKTKEELLKHLKLFSPNIKMLPITTKEKIKITAYKTAPIVTARIISHTYKRRFLE